MTIAGLEIVEQVPGRVISVEPASVSIQKDTPVPALDIHLRVANRWGVSKSAAYDVSTVLLGIVDLVLRWPWIDAHLQSMKINGHPRLPEHDISDLQFYEWVELIQLPRGLTHRAVVAPQAVHRIDALLMGAMNGAAARRDRLLKALLHVSRAAASTNATDRLAAIWAAFDVLMAPGPSDTGRIEDFIDEIALAHAVRDESDRESTAIAGLVSQVRRLGHDRWLRQGLRSRLVLTSRSRRQRLHVAVLVAYALRSMVVHGQFGYMRDADRIPTHHAAQLTWQLVERLIELEVLGARQKPMQALTARAITR